MGIVFNIIGSSKKFVYPCIVNVMMGFSEANELLYSPSYKDYLPREISPSGMQMAGDTAIKGIIENLILNLMNRTKNKVGEDKAEDEKKDENSRRLPNIRVNKKPENPEPKQIEDDE